MENPTSKGQIAALVKLVADEIASQPHSLDGNEWCALPQPVIAQKLGVSVATVRRIISCKPFVRQQKLVDGVKMTLLRVGEPGPLTPRYVANIMSKRWRRWLAARLAILREELSAARATLGTSKGQAKKDAFARIKKIRKELKSRFWTVSPREYGCMIGLAENWPDGHQVEMFEMVLARWSFFMVGVKWMVTDQEMEDQETIERFWVHPSISVIRRFYTVAIEMVTMDGQTEGKKVPPWIKALHPNIWKSIK